MSNKDIDQLLEKIRNTHRPTFEEQLDEMTMDELRQALFQSKEAAEAYKQGSGRMSFVYQLATEKQLKKQEMILGRISMKPSKT